MTSLIGLIGRISTYFPNYRHSEIRYEILSFSQNNKSAEESNKNILLCP